MLINRHNYEEFFLLYVDNELTVAQRRSVEAFVAENPDLEEELVMMMQSVLRPDKHIVFADKESLLKNKPANGLVNESNYEEYFVLYGDNELTNEEKDLIEQFVYKHPQYQAEFELIQQARFIPEQSVVYPDKNELYRTERDEKVVPFRWWRLAAAAIVVLFLGVTAWYMSGDETNTTKPPVAQVNESKDTQQVAKKKNAEAEKDNIAVKEENEKRKALTVPSADDVKENMAVTSKEKIIKKKSNIPDIRNVTQKSIEQDMAKAPVEGKVEQVKRRMANPVAVEIETALPDQPKPITTELAAAYTDPVTSIENPRKEIIYIDEYTADDEIKLANASLSKKPVRGLIRKVKGLFDSNDDNDPGQENKKGIRIAAFEIGLK